MPSTHIYLLQVCQKVVILPTCQPVSHRFVTRTNSNVCCFDVIFGELEEPSVPKGTMDKTGTMTTWYHYDPLASDDLGPPFGHEAAKVLRTARRHKGQTRGWCEMCCAQRSQIQKCLGYLHTEKRLAMLDASILKPIKGVRTYSVCNGYNYWHIKSYNFYNVMENRIIESFRGAPNDTSET